MRTSTLGLSVLLLLAVGAAATVACGSTEDDTADGAGELNDAPPKPTITRILANGQVIWQTGQTNKASVSPGQELTLQGSSFGDSPDKTLSKILVGSSRALERELPVFKGSAHLINGVLGGDVYDETPQKIDAWKTDIVAWSDTEIRFHVPVTVADGDAALVLQTQRFKDTLKDTSGKPVMIKDPLTDWLASDARAKVQSVSIGVPGPASASDPITVTVKNPDFEAARTRGEATFWAWDFNLGVAQKLANTDWDSIFGGTAVDPVTGQPVDPKDFGAIFIDDALVVPVVARQPHRFDPYPIANPLETLVTPSVKSGVTTPIQWVGYVKAEGMDPRVPLVGRGEWIGFNCASCHGQRIDYEAAPGQKVSKVFPGLPNTHWNAKWASYSGELRGLKGSESAFGGPTQTVDKTQLIHALPDGTAEGSLLSADGSGQFSNDHFYSPVAIPIITNHLPVRRALSRGELIAGFEGSYLHPQAPEGTMGPVQIPQLKDLTTYMGTLDRDHNLLVSIGMHQWLTHKNKLSEIGNAGEGAFVQMGMGKAVGQFPELAAKVNHGKEVFQRDCASCHQSNFGTNTDETLFAFTDVGTYFSPSLWNREGQGIRTAMIHDLYWVQGRGLLHDGHVRSTDAEHVDSTEMLVDPDRCVENSALYKQLYTISPTSFRIAKGTPDQERAIRQQAYFVDFPGGGSGDETKFLYWDYQQLRHSFGPRELATPKKELPAAPHPWCAKDKSDVDDLVHYLFTL